MNKEQNKIMYLVLLDYGYDGQRPLCVFFDKQEAETFVEVASHGANSYIIEEVKIMGEKQND
jgi:hypothetical protein